MSVTIKNISIKKKTENINLKKKICFDLGITLKMKILKNEK
jgi:hypothetical protein